MFVFLKKVPKCSYGLVECIFDNPVDFCRKHENLSLLVRKKINFPQKIIFPKCFCGHVECSFNNPVENFLPKVRKFFTRSPKKIIDFPKNSKPKYSSGHVECSFNYPAEKFSLKVRENFKFSAQSPTKFINL